MRRENVQLCSAILILLMICAVVSCPIASASEATPDLERIRSELNALRSDAEQQRKRADSDEATIRRLQAQLSAVEQRNNTLEDVTQTLQPNTNSLRSDIDAKLRARESDDHVGAFDSAIVRYLGQHQFTVVGAAAGDFICDRNAAQNTFSLLFEPVILYRLNDWLLFEGAIEASLPVGSSADFQLPVATAQIFLNDYMEINAGIFDQPFGGWYEDQSPVWVNRLITAPLLYGAEALVPPTDIGVQLRGSLQWGELGQDFDYTSWFANGPSFDSTLPAPAIGQTLNPQNNVAINTNGRAVGARLRVYPLLLDNPLGRVELGASTYNGKWMNGLWLNTWGIDFALLKGNFQARGEFLRTYRQMPAGSEPDNREGWYVQTGYFLQGLPPSGISDQIDNVIHRLELIARYSGVNQRAIVTDEIATSPSLGFNGSASVFTPHAREVALGADYWIAPSIVWQTEFDIELPRAGGAALTFAGNPDLNLFTGSYSQ